MNWYRVLAPWAGVCLISFSSLAYAQQRESLNPLARPLRDVGVVRERVPEPLANAASSPYAMPASADGRPNCAAINTEIAALDGALGADLDLRLRQRDGVGSMVAGAIRSAIDVPYRNVVRRLSGAERREREMRDAIQAGMVRRAFLRGIRDANCTGQINARQTDALMPSPTSPSFAALDAPDMTAEVSAPRQPAPRVRVAETTAVALRQDHVTGDN